MQSNSPSPYPDLEINVNLLKLFLQRPPEFRLNQDPPVNPDINASKSVASLKTQEEAQDQIFNEEEDFITDEENHCGDPTRKQILVEATPASPARSANDSLTSLNSSSSPRQFGPPAVPDSISPSTPESEAMQDDGTLFVGTPEAIIHRSFPSPPTNDVEELQTPPSRLEPLPQVTDSEYKLVPREKIVLKRKTQPEDVFMVANLPSKRSKQVEDNQLTDNAQEGEDVEDARAMQDQADAEAQRAQDPQWRVGKTPGHQGSHTRTSPKEVGNLEDEDTGGKTLTSRKRSLSQVCRHSSRVLLMSPEYRVDGSTSTEKAIPSAGYRFIQDSPYRRDRPSQLT